MGDPLVTVAVRRGWRGPAHPGDFPTLGWPGDYRGRDAIAAEMQKEMELLDGPPAVQPHDDLASDQHAVSLVIQTLRRGGRSLEVRTTVIAHVKDGLFSEVWLQPEDQAAYDEFFASP